MLFAENGGKTILLDIIILLFLFFFAAIFITYSHAKVAPPETA